MHVLQNHFGRTMANYKLQSNITSELSIKMSVKQQKTLFSNDEWILCDVSVPVCEVGGVHIMSMSGKMIPMMLG